MSSLLECRKVLVEDGLKVVLPMLEELKARVQVSGIRLHDMHQIVAWLPLDWIIFYPLLLHTEPPIWIPDYSSIFPFHTAGCLIEESSYECWRLRKEAA